MAPMARCGDGLGIEALLRDRLKSMRTQTRTRARTAALGLLLLAGCLAASALPAKTLRFASAFDPQSMDPHALALQYQTRVVSQIYESLVNRGRNFELEPSLA